MLVKFIRPTTNVVAGADGPFTVEYAVDQEVELPDLHGHIYVAKGDAVLLEESPEESEPESESEPEPEPESEPESESDEEQEPAAEPAPRRRGRGRKSASAQT